MVSAKRIALFSGLALQFFLLVLPWRIRRRCLEIAFGFEIDPSAYIGRSFVSVRSCVMKPQSRIGNFNFIRNLDRLELAEDAGIGTFNTITGYPGTGKGSFEHLCDRKCELMLHPMSGITSRHFIDCTAGVTVGVRSTIAGIRSTILTHSIDVYRNRQDAKSVRIGNGCFIGTNTIILAGVEIPENCVIGGGSVVNKSLANCGAVYAGNPVEMKRSLDVAGTQYFHRARGNVS
ncbi:acyltransferase [Sulfitobacter sp. MOLA879]|uniref:acyltransferase n=1 Tax=Sulfitobacter sp. MOLA879 TaxID=3368579 RepID=UPI003744C913